MEEWGKMTPTSLVKVEQTAWISPVHFRSLIQLYQPIIDTRSASLYCFLAYEMEPNTYHSDFFRVSDLLTGLNCSMKELMDARVKLEAIGLIRTFRNEVENTYVIELEAPVLPERFFEDALLSTLLLEHVGKKRFSQLVDRYTYASINSHEKGNDVSAHFSEVFSVPYRTADYHLEKKESVRFVADREKGVEVSSTLDWKLVEEFAQSSFVKKEMLTSTVRQKIEALHSIYRLTEQQLALLLIEAEDPIKKEISIDTLNRIVETSFSRKKQAESSSGAEPKKPLQTDSSQEASVSSLLAIAERLSPIEFLQSLKHQMGTYVTPAEQQVLRELGEWSGLSPAVLNMLMYYILITQNNATIGKDYAHKIASDWAKQQLKSAKDAYMYLRRPVTTNKKSSTNKKETRSTSSSYSKTQKRVEKVPEWAKTEQNRKETPVDEEERIRLRNLLNNT